jgi:hypothetical protein
MQQDQPTERILTKPLALLTLGHLITDFGQGATTGSAAVFKNCL